jgi:S-adenosylmethionine synthetase
VDETLISECVDTLFDLTPKGIIASLDLLKPIYRKTASYGHFGREDQGFGWEKLDKVADIKAYLKL